MNYYMVVALFAVVVFTAMMCHEKCQAQVVGDAVVVPIVELQEIMLDVVHSPGDASPEAQARREVLIVEMFNIVSGDKVVLLQQWIHCLRNNQEYDESNPNLQIALVYLLSKFEFSREDYARAFFPLLETSDNDLREHAERYLSVADVMPDYTVNFDVYRVMLKDSLKRRNEIPAACVRYMLSRSPGHTVIELMMLDEQASQTLRTELSISDRIADWPVSYRGVLVLSDEHSRPLIASELGKLSHRREWWIKLLVAEFIKQVPELATKELRARLSESDHPLVKEALDPEHN